MSGYPNTTHHEDIPPRIGARERDTLLTLNLSKANGGGWKGTPASTNQSGETLCGDGTSLGPASQFCECAAAILTLTHIHTHTHNPKTHRDVVGLPVDSTHARTGRQKRGGGGGGGRGPAERKLPRLPPYPAFLSPTGATAGGERAAETQLKRSM